MIEAILLDCGGVVVYPESGEWLVPANLDEILNGRKLSFNRDPVGIVNNVAHDFSDLCKAYENACAIIVAQTALNVIFRVKIGIDVRFYCSDIRDLIYKFFLFVLLHIITFLNRLTRRCFQIIKLLNAVLL